MKSSPALTKLITRQCTLVPEFNPAVNEYSLNVPCDIKDIEFDVDSENSSGININRHKLCQRIRWKQGGSRSS